jgi:hypothetical protein
MLTREVVPWEGWKAATVKWPLATRATCWPEESVLQPYTVHSITPMTSQVHTSVLCRVQRAVQRPSHELCHRTDDVLAQVKRTARSSMRASLTQSLNQT